MSTHYVAISFLSSDARAAIRKCNVSPTYFISVGGKFTNKKNPRKWSELVIQKDIGAGHDEKATVD